jgi:hypothetical protein
MVLGAMVLGAMVLGAMVLGAMVLGAMVLGAMVLGAMMLACQGAGVPRCRRAKVLACKRRQTVTYRTGLPQSMRNRSKSSRAKIRVTVLMFGWNDRRSAALRSRSMTTRTWW